MNADTLAQFKTLVEGLTPSDKAELVVLLGTMLKADLPDERKDTVPASSGHWGQQLIATLNELDTSEWEAMDIPDSVEWVKEQRRQRNAKRMNAK